MPLAGDTKTDVFGPLPDCQLLVFARAPVAGRCKTRLMPRYGARGAASIHQRLLLRSLRTANQVGAELALHCEPHTGHGFFLRCRRNFALRLKRQVRGDLGRKMALALQHALRHAQRVVIIGTDCAALRADDITAAFAALANVDYVLQPADDGGYVLIGARRAAPAALRNIDWSSGRERAQTLARLRRLGLSYRLLSPSWDVDHPRDVRKARRLQLL